MLASYYILNAEDRVCVEAKRKTLQHDILTEHYMNTAEKASSWEWSDLANAAIIRTKNFITVLTMHGVSYEERIFEQQKYLAAI